MPAALSPDLAAAVDLAKTEKAVSTRKAYGSDFRLFKVKAWCEAKVVSALPASPETVAAFLAAETGQGTKPSTLTRRVNAVLAHAPQQPLPDLSAHRHIRSMATATRQTKITFAEMRDSGVRDILIYCSDYRCSHLVTMSADCGPGDLRLSDIEPRFVCSNCGRRGADVRPDFGTAKMGTNAW